jgi:hypothetical protein
LGKGIDEGIEQTLEGLKQRGQPTWRARAEMVLNAAKVAYMALARGRKGRQKLYDTHADM